MTTATVTPSKSGKPAKFRRDHKINWWLTAAVAVLSLTILIPLYFTIVTALKTPAEAGTFPPRGSGITSPTPPPRSTTRRPRSTPRSSRWPPWCSPC